MAAALLPDKSAEQPDTGAFLTKEPSDDLELKVKTMFNFSETYIAEVEGRALDYPAGKTYNKFTPEDIKALCKLDAAMFRMFGFDPWEDQHPRLRLFHRLKSYWIVQGASDPGGAALVHLKLERIPNPNPEWEAECKAYGWFGKPNPTNLRELEAMALPPVAPNIQLIIERCPQMAMLHALRGDVKEPYWWAALSITEHSTPNLSRECSDGYTGFSVSELGYRVGRINNEGIKPALCERFDAANRGVCNLCKFSAVIRSPIALGYSHEPKHKKGVPK